MGLVSRKERFLNDKECFMLRVELPTAKDVALFLAKAGVVNPKTGKPFDANSIRLASHRWVINHPEEARPYYQAENIPFAFNDEEWTKWLILTAINVHKKSRIGFFRWLKAQNIDREKYKPVYAKVFGLEGWDID